MPEDNVFNNDEDFFLQNIVKLSNKFGVGFDITLLVSGVTVSGTLISGKDYYEGQGDVFLKLSKQEDSIEKTLGEFWKGFSAIYDAEENENVTLEDVPAPTYIHLSNAQIVSGITITPQPPIAFWRGKISSVDGFFIGRVSPGAG